MCDIVIVPSRNRSGQDRVDVFVVRGGVAIGPAPLPTLRPTSSSFTSSLLKRAPLHMKKMPNEGGTKAMAVAAAARNRIQQIRPVAERSMTPGLPTQRSGKRRSVDDDILGEALEGRRRMRSSGPSPANDDDYEVPRPGTYR